jgi:hypothetical protein
MARISYPSTSPYASTPQANWFIGNYVHRKIPSSDTDKTFTITVKYANRPDLLAYDLYGNPAYWWVFSNRNPNVLRDPIWDFEVGKVIIVPSQTHLKAALG